VNLEKPHGYFSPLHTEPPELDFAILFMRKALKEEMSVSLHFFFEYTARRPLRGYISEILRLAFQRLALLRAWRCPWLF